jgi:hypothetical protein
MNWVFRFLIWTVPDHNRRRFFDALVSASAKLEPWQATLMWGWLEPIGKKKGWVN